MSGNPGMTTGDNHDEAAQNRRHTFPTVVTRQAVPQRTHPDRRRQTVTEPRSCNTQHGNREARRHRVFTKRRAVARRAGAARPCAAAANPATSPIA
ncbi:hypothetical protein CBM2586_B10037 [Cupriavidus phytorum]|uniref:Uncharacterized protein n=1 Tax=Cupriavidus taiwanensis TaxID=164546 RepID=A0A375C8L1_9BURK|nr:hypothetical protein CBM2586_B10037 [Cupriavidus taiwanensis]